jgi:hypothetical protein
MNDLSPPTAKTVCDDLAFVAIVEATDLAVSYATSAREAAWRGDRRLLAGHLAQLRLCVITALDAHKKLSPTPQAGRHG